jgi:hypothetical protein
MRAEEFDRKFDDGEDVTGDLDLAAIRRPALEQRRVNVDFPSWMIESLDREARRLGSPDSPSSRSGSLSALRTAAPPPEVIRDRAPCARIHEPLPRRRIHVVSLVRAAAIPGTGGLPRVRSRRGPPDPPP